jgi:hypothetical protein
MDYLTFPEFNSYVDTYVSEMISAHVMATETLPQTLADCDYCINRVIDLGIMRPGGIGSVTLDQFYDFDMPILDGITDSAFDDILDEIYQFIPNGHMDHTNLDEICSIYLDSYVYNNRTQFVEYIMSITNMLRNNSSE